MSQQIRAVAMGAIAALGSVMAQAQSPQAVVYNVTATGLSTSQYGVLIGLLRTGKAVRLGDGSVRFVSENFHKIPSTLGAKGFDENKNPTQDELLDFDAAAKVVPFDGKSATTFLTDAFRKAELLPAVTTPKISNSTFDLYDRKGVVKTHGVLDTTVNLDAGLGDGTGVNRPFFGPGQKILARFDSQGNIADLLVALRRVTPGPKVNILTSAAALDLARTQFNLPKNAVLRSQLVYFAPPLGRRVTKIFPHYLINGSFTVGRETVQMRSVLLPAVQDQMTVSVSTDIKGTTVTGKPNIVGGTAPYRFFWSSSQNNISGPTASPITYTEKPRALGPDVLSVRVEDANGLVAFGSASIPTPARMMVSMGDYGNGGQLSPNIKPQAAAAGSSAGIEWIGMTSHLAGCNDLSGSGPSAYGFHTGMTAKGVNVKFDFGETNAWEKDYRSVGLAGGQDSSYTDNVDMIFYSGHANGDGFVMSSNRDNQFVNYNEVRAGDRQCEWFCVAACGPLETGVVSRWANSFQGLHFLFGYATVSMDNTVEGPNLATYTQGYSILGIQILPPLPVRQSWIMMAESAQPSSVTWGFMQPVRTDGVCNWNDYWWGRGPTGPDISNAQTAYYCVVRGSC